MKLHTWVKSRRCESAGCVEVAGFVDEVRMRDSKRLEGPVLRFDTLEWTSFIQGVKDGEFNTR